MRPSCRPAAVALTAGLAAFAAACSHPVPATNTARVTSIASSTSDSAAGAPYADFQVDEMAVPFAANPVPPYPEDLRSAGVTGDVLVEFIVDTLGRAEAESVKMLRATHAGFAESVLAVLPVYRFTPAKKDGRKVRVYVQMPFRFRFENRAPTPPPGWRLEGRP